MLFKSLFSISLVLLTMTLQAQVMVGTVDINQEKNVKYCELVGTVRMFSHKATVLIDYGQKRKAFKAQIIKDKMGKRQSFTSMIAALNFMEENGWTYVSSYVVAFPNSNVHRWLLKRKRS